MLPVNCALQSTEHNIFLMYARVNELFVFTRLRSKPFDGDVPAAK